MLFPRNLSSETSLFPHHVLASCISRGLALNLLFSLISTSSVSVCQTSRPRTPHSCSFPSPGSQMSATLSPASLIPSAWNFGLINPVSCSNRNQTSSIALFQDHSPLAALHSYEKLASLGFPCGSEIILFLS